MCDGWIYLGTWVSVGPPVTRSTTRSFTWYAIALVGKWLID